MTPGRNKSVLTAHLEVLEQGLQMNGPEFAVTEGYWYSVTVRNNGPWAANVQLWGDQV